MLLHIRPRLFAPLRNIELVDLSSEKLGLHLLGGKDLATRRPYPNKGYAVACRRQGRKALNGLLIDAPNGLDSFDIKARWAVEAEVLVNHHVEYRLLDHDFDTASDNAMLWHACSADLGGWSSRFPESARGKPTMALEPLMEILPGTGHRLEADDELKGGLIISRRQVFAMPTIERERLFSSQLGERIPPLETVFTAATHCAQTQKPSKTFRPCRVFSRMHKLTFPL